MFSLYELLIHFSLESVKATTKNFEQVFPNYPWYLLADNDFKVFEEANLLIANIPDVIKLAQLSRFLDFKKMFREEFRGSLFHENGAHCMIQSLINIIIRDPNHF